MVSSGSVYYTFADTGMRLYEQAPSGREPDAEGRLREPSGGIAAHTRLRMHLYWQAIDLFSSVKRNLIRIVIRVALADVALRLHAVDGIKIG